MKVLLCNAQYFYIVDSDTAQPYTKNTLLLFHCNDGYAKAPQFYVISTLPALLHSCKQPEDSLTQPKHVAECGFQALSVLFVCFWRDSPPLGHGLLLIHDVSISHTKTHQIR